MDFEKYVNKLPFPTKPTGTKRITVENKTEALQAAEYFDTMILTWEEYNKKRIEYKKEDDRLLNLFADDLFIELGIENNPKRETLFNLAYERGHAGGLEEIYNEAISLALLIK